MTTVPDGDGTVGLGKRAANYVPLTPVSLLERTVAVHPEWTAVVYGERCWSYAAFHNRCHRLAAMLCR